MKNYLIEKILSNEIDPAFARRAKIILKNLELKDGGKVLDIGCGRGFYLRSLKKLNKKLEVIGLDLNQDYLNKAKRFTKNFNVKIFKADATKLPFKDNSFDGVIASEILEHITADQKVISEIYRVLKSEGVALISVPNKNYPFLWDPLNWILEKLFKVHLPANIWWLSGIWADHVRLYSKIELEKKIKKSGFKIEKWWQSTHYCLPFSHFLFYGIGKNLVELGLFKNLNRFNSDQKESFIKKIIFEPIRLVDRFNKDSETNKSTVNWIIKVRKIKDRL